MRSLNDLFAIATVEGIDVSYHNIKKDGLLGLYVAHPRAGPMVFLDNQLIHRTALHKSVFAEEIGHYMTAPRTNILRVCKSFKMFGENNETIMMAQDERAALRWATGFLMPDVELCRALSQGYRTCYELAEYFDVTEWLVYRKVELWKKHFAPKEGIRAKYVERILLGNPFLKDFKESAHFFCLSLGSGVFLSIFF